MGENSHVATASVPADHLAVERLSVEHLPPEHLVPEACWALLRSTGLGRLAFVLDGQLENFPVNFVVRDRTVVFRTSAGTKLSAVHVHATVAFEADGEDDAGAWSVIVKGRLREITQVIDPAELEAAALHPRPADRKEHIVELSPGEITGRRI